jgi:alginate O-acetyltransferase complex protein AlgI
MSFAQIEFHLVFCVLLVAYYVTRSATAQKISLVFFSIYFLAAFHNPTWYVIALPITIDYYLARTMARIAGRRTRQWMLAASICLNLGLLCLFKYAVFFAQILQDMFPGLDFTVAKLVAPIGISFYVFQSISFMCDIYRGKVPPAECLLDYAEYLLFFPKIVAGPIERYANYRTSRGKRVAFQRENLEAAFTLFCTGAFKKYFLADNLGYFVDEVYRNHAVYDGLTLALASVAYALQLYCDFAGYSDMAIGLARALGIRLADNFNFPYLAVNIGEFWRRWHISLSTWIRDYLYIPLGGSRRGSLRTIANLLLAMALCGLWHGSAWTFVAWGGYHGALLAVSRGVTLDNGSTPRRLLCILLTNLSVCLGWVLFRAETLPKALAILAKIVMLGGGIRWIDPFALGTFLAAVAFHILHAHNGELLPRLITGRASPAVAFAMLLTVIIYFPKASAPFIYAQF